MRARERPSPLFVHGMIRRTVAAGVSAHRRPAPLDYERRRWRVAGCSIVDRRSCIATGPNSRLDGRPHEPGRTASPSRVTSLSSTNPGVLGPRRMPAMMRSRPRVVGPRARRDVRWSMTGRRRSAFSCIRRRGAPPARHDRHALHGRRCPRGVGRLIAAAPAGEGCDAVLGPHTSTEGSARVPVTGGSQPHPAAVSVGRGEPLRGTPRPATRRRRRARPGCRRDPAPDRHDCRAAPSLTRFWRHLPLGDARADLPDDPAQNCVALRVHDLPFPRLRRPYAIRDWSVHSSMKPGLACWEKRPPDSPKPASAGS